DAFHGGAQRTRALQPISNPKLIAMVGQVQIRLSPDLVATDRDETKRIYYNCRASSVDPELARITLEMASWLLEQNDIDDDPRHFELVDLASNRVFRGRSRRAMTLRRVRQTAQVIEALWDSI